MIRLAQDRDIDALVGLRLALWPGEALEVRRAEVTANLARAGRDIATFVAEEAGEVIAFAEVTLRRDHVNGCETSPVAFLEGIFVRPEQRRRGVGRALVAMAEQWGRERGCRELASDALLGNELSRRFHGGAGFEETERVVYFRKLIGEP